MDTTFPSTETVVIVNHFRVGHIPLIVNRVPSFSYIDMDPVGGGFEFDALCKNDILFILRSVIYAIFKVTLILVTYVEDSSCW